MYIYIYVYIIYIHTHIHVYHISPIYVHKYIYIYGMYYVSPPKPPGEHGGRSDAKHSEHLCARLVRAAVDLESRYRARGCIRSLWEYLEAQETYQLLMTRLIALLSTGVACIRPVKATVIRVTGPVIGSS